MKAKKAITRKALHAACLQLGRSSLACVLLLTVLVKSTVGEAVVIHQHGSLWTHLHVLGIGDLLSNAAWSPNFGHGLNPWLNPRAQPVRTIAIVHTGLVFVSTQGAGGIDAAEREIPHPIPQIVIVGPQEPLSNDLLIQISSIRAAKNSAAMILLQNHTLLL